MNKELIIENWLGGKISHQQLNACIDRLVFERREYQ